MEGQSYLNMKAIAIHVFIGISILHYNIAQEAGDNLFDNSFLHQINFEALNLEQIIPYIPGYYDEPVKMTIDGTVVDSIFIRRKGFTSNEFNDTNPPFKIDIDDFIPDQEYDGIDKFNLHNHHLDEYFQRNALAYALYRRAGVAAPRTSFAEVYINGNFIEIYTITEDIEKTFLQQNFASNDGSLYKGAEFPPNSVIVQEGTIEAYNNFITNANPNNIGSIVDLHNYFRILGLDLIIKDWDIYARGSHNFYMYQEPKSEKLHLITWDHNFAFSFFTDFTNSLYPTRPFENSITTDPIINPLYLQTMCDLLSYTIDEEYIEALALHNYNILSDNTNQISVPLPDPIIGLIATQRQWFRNKLEEEGFSNCDALILPIETGDIVINEFVAKNDSDGVLESNGETGDWIELYNNTSLNISMDQKFYLSDDKEFPKKWHFEEDVIIPANGYLIIWADRDLDQVGIHTNFKLNSSEGDLLLTYEDLTELQYISYEEQQLNMGYARVPNGTGDFIIQPHTFNANNENVVSAFENLEELEIYPNPTNGFIHMENLNQEGMILITNISGQNVLRTNARKELNLSNLSAGIYWIEVQTDKDRIIRKLVIAKN